MMMMAVTLLLTCSAASALSGGSPLRRRAVPITPDLTLSVFEVASPAQLVEQWSTGIKTASDPFGVVLWPGALYAAQKLSASPEKIAGATCLVVGAGTGLEAITAATLGASKVIAVDINPLTLNLLADAAKENGVHDRIETRILDLTSEEPLPEASVHIYADTLYSAQLSFF